MACYGSKCVVRMRCKHACLSSDVHDGLPIMIGQAVHSRLAFAWRHSLTVAPMCAATCCHRLQDRRTSNAHCGVDQNPDATCDVAKHEACIDGECVRPQCGHGISGGAGTFEYVVDVGGKGGDQFAFSYDGETAHFVVEAPIGTVVLRKGPPEGSAQLTRPNSSSLVKVKVKSNNWWTFNVGCARTP